VQRLLDGAEGRPEYPLLAQVALRSMKQARYTEENLGHFGLAAPVYAHFTSPIRRYPDLVVHRLLRASRRGRRDALARLAVNLEETGEACSRLEREAEAAERELLEQKKIEYIRGRVGETFDGIVTTATRFGLFVQLSDTYVEGLAHVARLDGDRYELDEKRHELRGLATGRRFRMGDKIRVVLDRVDPILRRVDLSLERSEAPTGAPAGGRRAGRRVEGRPRGRGKGRHR
jgi:ribonuclease R